MDYKRADATYITPQARQAILHHFGLQDAKPLAIGTEAEVYAYRTDKLVKLYAGADRLPFIKTLQHFYANLDMAESGLILPAIHEIYAHGELIASLESRVPGQPLDTLLTAQADHVQAETLYLNALWQLQQIKVNFTPSTYLLFDSNGHSDISQQGFDAFYADLLARKIQQVSDYFAIYDPAFTEKAASLVAAIRSHHTDQLYLIHGDFFPGNLLVDPALTHVHGIIDFGSFTMFGNYLVDVAGAFSFYRMYDPDRASIRERMQAEILHRLDDTETPLFFQYLLANAILTSDLYTSPGNFHNDGHFQWAVEIVTTEYYWKGALI